jgi:hypothetical protein
VPTKATTVPEAFETNAARVTAAVPVTGGGVYVPDADGVNTPSVTALEPTWPT